MDVNIWLKNLETYLETYDVKLRWGSIAVTYIAEDCLKKVDNLDEVRNTNDGFETLSKQLKEQ